MQITKVEGTELANLVRGLNHLSKAGRLHSLRIHQGPQGIIYKINEGMWTPPVGSDGRS